MSQNNMVNFITLTDWEHGVIELNPAFIVMMRRDTLRDVDYKNGAAIPVTTIFTSIHTNHPITVFETPEQIAQMQMDALAKAIKSVVGMTTDIYQELEEEI